MYACVIQFEANSPRLDFRDPGQTPLREQARAFPFCVPAITEFRLDYPQHMKRQTGVIKYKVHTSVL